jgi:hypothetical protein
MSDTFGFEAAAAPKKTTKERLASIKPSAPDTSEVPLAVVDAVAEAQGFTSREATKPEPPSRAPRRYKTGRNQQFNVKVSPETLTRFYAEVERRGLSVAETFEIAVDALEKDNR